MDDMTREEIEALLARVPEGYTPGPWKEFVDDSGGQWSGWPLSVEATAETDKTVVRTGGQWPYEWDAKTSQHEACANAALLALAPDLAAALRQTLARNAELEAALRPFAAVADALPEEGGCSAWGFASRDKEASITPDDFRRARAARAALTGDASEGART